MIKKGGKELQKTIIYLIEKNYETETISEEWRTVS